MNASLNEKLRAVKWGEYKLGDLFEINPTKYYRLANDKILSKSGITPLVSNASIANGVMGFSNLNPLNKGNSLSCSDTTLGAETMYYQKNDYIGYQHIQSLMPKFDRFNSAIAFFIISASHAATSNGQYDYGHKFNRKSMRKTVIFLPICDDGSIDFDFMESFIAELEAERIAELEAYLLATGLTDYILTAEEKAVLQAFRDGKNGGGNLADYQLFNTMELFGKSTRGKRLKSADRIEGTLPFVTAGEADEGVSAFIGNDVEVFSKNTITIDMFGSAKYRNYDYGGDDHIAVVHTENLPKLASVFVTAAIHKSSHTGKFDYGHNFYAKDADELNIFLPALDGKPDYALMETLISAVQKLVIKDVVQYADRKIAAIKEVALKL